MKTYAIVQAIFWPCVIWGYGFILIESKFYSLDGACFIRYFKLTLRYLTKMLTTYVAFNSAVVATCRYLFVVRDQEVAHFSIKRTRRILIVASFAVPFIIVNLDEVFIAHGWSPLDRNSSKQIQSIEQSPLYTLTDNYVPVPVIYGMRVVFYILLLVIMSNIGEGFLYFRIFVHLKR